VIGLDTSSSISAQTLRLFTTEAEAIARRTGAEAHLLAFDETVFAQERLDPNGWAALRETGLRSGGGTSFDDLFEKASRIRPAITVVLTDLDAPLPPAPGFPVLWAVPNAVAAPAWGRVLRIGDHIG
jgi:predicted metal-dependent peptidase